MPSLRRGIFLTFEGIEGSGKTTQAARLAECLRSAGWAVTLIREPGGTPLAEAVRALLLAREGAAPEPLSEAFLFQAARADLVAKVIEPALTAGAVVIADRYADASVAYQGIARGLGRDRIEALNALATGGRSPDRTYLMDLPVDVALSRVRSRAGKASPAAADAAMTRLDAEPVAFHEKVRAGYLEIAASHPARIRVWDATESPEQQAAGLWQDVQELLEASR